MLRNKIKYQCTYLNSRKRSGKERHFKERFNIFTICADQNQYVFSFFLYDDK